MSIKCRLQEILDDEGRKQSWLANASNCDRSNINTICSGKSNPSLEVALKIAKALNRKIEDIWELE